MKYSSINKKIRIRKKPLKLKKTKKITSIKGIQPLPQVLKTCILALNYTLYVKIE